MPLVQWNDSFSVKIDSIDRQHMKLFAMINEFHDAIVAKKSKEAMGPLLRKLTDYTVEHFAVEERHFKQHGYPDAPAHLKQHEDLVAKVQDMIQRHDEGKMLLTLEVSGFLKDWLTNHIQKTDKKYAPFLISKGVK